MCTCVCVCPLKEEGKERQRVMKRLWKELTFLKKEKVVLVDISLDLITMLNGVAFETFDRQSILYGYLKKSQFK